jgi:thiol-disulfide isomerase/thioredoxin
MRRTLLLTALCASGLFVSPLRAQDAKPAAPAAKQEVPAAGAKRTAEQVAGDLESTGNELRKFFASPDALVDPAQRKAAADKVVPLMKRMVAGLDEMAQVQPDTKAQVADARLEFTMMLALFGDAAAAAALDRDAKAGQGVQAVEARCAQQVVAFLKDPKDEAAQLKAVDELKRIAKANPTEPRVAQTLIRMAETGAASPAVVEKAEDVIVNDLTSEPARQVAEQIRAERRKRDSVGKPIELAATKLDGGAFTTRDWKGKVVLVDFWATWCPPCIAAMPKLKKLYVDYHAKGLEIVGVSSDAEVAQLKEFLDKNKDAPWPQLFDPKAAAENPDPQSPPLHPLARQWGVRLPAMFLIDRKGVLRSVEAFRDYEEMIPKLIAEKAE